MIRLFTTAAPDFSVYWGGALLLFKGLSLYGQTGLFTGIGYPPQTLLLFLPFLPLGYYPAQNAWTVVSLFSLFLSIWLVCKMLNKSMWFFFLASGISIFTFPAKFTLGMGQSNLITLGFVVLSCWFSVKEKPVLSGILLGLATILKPHMFIIVLGLAIAGKFRLVWMSAGVTHLVSVFLTGLLFGWADMVRYVTVELPYMARYRGQEIYYNQGIRAMVSRMLPDFPILILILSAAILIYSLIRIRNKSYLQIICLLLPVLLLIEPLSWQHHYVFLIPTVMYLASYRNIALWFGVLLVSMNLDLAQTKNMSWYMPLVLSHAGIGNAMIYMMMLKKI